MKYLCGSILIFLSISCGVDEVPKIESEQIERSAEIEEYYSAQLTGDSVKKTDSDDVLEIDLEPAEPVIPEGIGYAPDVVGEQLVDEAPLFGDELAATYMPLPKCEACICGAAMYPHESEKSYQYSDRVAPCIGRCGAGAIIKYFNTFGWAVVAAKAKCSRYKTFLDEERASNWKGVCFWVDRDFRGERVCYSTGNYAWIGHHFNDKISSMILYGGARAVLYEHIDFGGKSVSIPSSRYNYGYRDLSNSDETISRILPRHDSMSSFKIY